MTAGGRFSCISFILKVAECQNALRLIRPARVVDIGLVILQQETVVYYVPTIFQLAGFETAAKSILATVSVGLTNVLVTIGAFRLVDRVGRRLLLLIGLTGMIPSLSVLGLAFQLPALVGSLKWIAIGSLIVVRGLFCRWPGTGVLAVDLGDLPAKDPRSRHKHCDRSQPRREPICRAYVSFPDPVAGAPPKVLNLQSRRRRGPGTLSTYWFRKPKGDALRKQAVTDGLASTSARWAINSVGSIGGLISAES